MYGGTEVYRVRIEEAGLRDHLNVSQSVIDPANLQTEPTIRTTSHIQGSLMMPAQRCTSDGAVRPLGISSEEADRINTFTLRNLFLTLLPSHTSTSQFAPIRRRHEDNTHLGTRSIWPN
ncbi:hypothetical protein CSKR_113771 [Clonorchis sinensis]|uniref:Uncharacterized protein n=1 Tax=Clonorchis sinensis TaxID=79923 RepID=A0A3R7FPR8_CLOSI|nr:hypothetical protein CSKR_113771 [Clonorchis sinensis]